MARNGYVVVVGGLLVLAVVAALAVLFGPLGVPGVGGPGGGVDGDPTATSTTPQAPAFELTVGNVTPCGATCRVVNTTLENVGTAPARNVTVEVNVSADGDRVWSGEATVGTLSAGESYATSRRVDVGLGGAAAIQANDGYVTIETTVRHDGDPVTFTDRRKVT